ncbi:MAG: hypothetical protein RLZ98_1631 [Pseudomonadota bacterium]
MFSGAFFGNRAFARQWIGKLKNKIIESLPETYREHFQSRLTEVQLKRMTTMERPGAPIKYAYFLESGLASVIAVGPNDNRTEVGIIGKEGLVGWLLVLGGERAHSQTMVQIEGVAYRIKAAELLQEISESPDLRKALLRFSREFIAQVKQTALAYSRATIPERLARWILMAQDRVGRDSVALTHEMLSLMLGVRRAGVTEALKTLSEKGLIERGSGRITVRDRAGLITCANGFY